MNWFAAGREICSRLLQPNRQDTEIAVEHRWWNRVALLCATQCQMRGRPLSDGDRPDTCARVERIVRTFV